MKRQLRAPSPALVISLIALFVALAGTAYAAAGLPRNSVGTKQLKNGAVTPPKVAQKTIALFKGQTGPPGPKGNTGPSGPQGPGAISVVKEGLPLDGSTHVLATVDGVEAHAECLSLGIVELDLVAHQAGDTGFASGDYASGGTLSPIQSDLNFGIQGNLSADLDVIAWVKSVGKVARFDLGASESGNTCNVWGMVTPSS
jgi:hypothetical protein